MTIRNSQQGFVMTTLLGMLLVFILLMGIATTVIDSNFFVVNRNAQSQQAFNIAEAGINYYLWHLSHSPTDYKDGKTTPTTPDPALGYGPYEHVYTDANAVNRGTFTLWINPQGGGSTIVRVRSIGKDAKSGVLRTIEAQLGAPSFADYAVLSDTALWFGSTESATGPVHSNQGVRMDGASSSDVTSANTSYTPSNQLGGDGNSHPGVWCSASVVLPVNCNTRSKVDWRYPVPSVDFNQVSGSLCAMKKVAFQSSASTSALANQANACTQTPTTRTSAYLPQRSATGSYSLTRGYLIQLNNNGTYDLFNVNGENDQASSYSTALSLQSVATGIAVPSNGVIFAEDNVWVRTATNSSFHGRVTIGAGRLASSGQNAEIVIADDVLYSTKNGQDAIGLVAESNVTLAPYAPPQSGGFNFEVDAAVIAQTGSVLYPSDYRTSQGKCTKGWSGSNQTFTFYGSVSSRQSWTWTWLQGGGSCGNAVNVPGTGYVSGILNNDTQYDNNLEYSPPPSFPTTSSYNILSWREVLTKP